MPVAWQRTVKQMLLDLGVYVKDSFLVRATSNAGDTTHFATTDLAGRTVDSLIDSELWPWVIPAGSNSTLLRPPQLLTANDAAGLLTLNKAIFTAVYQTGNPAVIQNINGHGYPQDAKEFALMMAQMELFDPNQTTVQEIATPSTTDYWNAIPAALASVYRVANYWAATGQEEEVMPAVWQDRLDFAGWRLNLPYAYGTLDKVRVYGRAAGTPWWDTLRDATTGLVTLASYDAPVLGDPTRLLRLAIPWLEQGKRDSKARRDVESHYRLQFAKGFSRAMSNEVFRS